MLAIGLSHYLTVGAILPMTFAVDAFRALVTGSGASLVPAVAGLAAWLVGSLLVTLAVAYRPGAADLDETELAAA